MDNWEIYYRTHAGKVLTGSPPLSFVSNGENLADYRIYGASGGVGDKTDNLWNEKATTDTNEYIDVNGNIATGVEKRYLYLKVNVSPSTNYVFKWTENVLGTDGTTPYIRISEYTQSNRFIRRVLCNCSEQTQKAFSFRTNSNTSYIDVRTESATSLKGQHLTGVMLITGTIPPETYEPYGYKIPIICGDTTTNIYLDEPLRKTSKLPTGKLPTGYTQVEYIRSTGTQYIDTNFIPNQDTRIKVKIMTKDISGMVNKTVFGSRESANSEHYGVTMGNGSQNSWWTGYGTSSISTNSYALRDTLYEIEKNKNVTILNGSVLATHQSQTFTCPSNLYLFCMNQSDPKFYSNIELYLCKIWDNDVLIRNFIPCKNPSNVIGMYDTVNDVFYSNAGTGSFIAGAEVETVYYTDYIDYAAQKRHNSDGTESSVTLPEISTLAGTNTLTVLTEVQPSNMYIKYDGSGNVNQSLMKYLEYKYKFAKE
jgi:hypothetical protein